MNRLQSFQEAFVAANHEQANEPLGSVVIACPNSCSVQYHFKDDHTGHPVKDLLYCADLPDGRCLVGRTDHHGNTFRIYTQQPEQVTLRWGRDAEVHLRKQDITF